MPDETRLIWVDMEMTGLNPTTDRIIEIAAVITDNALNVVAQSEALAIAQPAAVLEKAGLAEAIGPENVLPHVEAAIRRAHEIFAREYPLEAREAARYS